jgi:hypothetical protein
MRWDIHRLGGMHAAKGSGWRHQFTKMFTCGRSRAAYPISSPKTKSSNHAGSANSDVSIGSHMIGWSVSETVFPMPSRVAGAADRIWLSRLWNVAPSVPVCQRVTSIVKATIAVTISTALINLRLGRTNVQTTRPTAASPRQMIKLSDVT